MAKHKSYGKFNSVKIILLLVFLAILVIAVTSIHNAKDIKNSHALLAQCSTYSRPATCYAAGCQWGKKTYCRDLWRVTECTSHSKNNCSTRNCTMTDCQNRVKGCTFNGNYCAPAKGSPCAGLNELTCKSRNKDWGCTWRPRVCNGTVCQYSGPLRSDPGFIIPGCFGTPKPTTPTPEPECVSGNQNVIKKYICDITACYWENIPCPSGTRCITKDAYHPSTGCYAR